MSGQTITDKEVIQAPWSKEIQVQEVEYEGGFKMIRLRIKEGRRFTDLELDPATAAGLGNTLKSWVDENVEQGEGGS